MSKTRGHTKSIRLSMHTRNKMPPYLADNNRGRLKYVPELSNKTGISTLGKLVARNANRSLKKAARAQGKRDIDSGQL